MLRLLSSKGEREKTAVSKRRRRGDARGLPAVGPRPGRGSHDVVGARRHVPCARAFPRWTVAHLQQRHGQPKLLLLFRRAALLEPQARRERAEVKVLRAEGM